MKFRLVIAFCALLGGGTSDALSADPKPQGQLTHLLTTPRSSQAIKPFKSSWFTIYEDSNPKSDFFQTRLCVAEFPSLKSKLRIKNTRSVDHVSKVFESASNRSTIAVINGGYFGYGSKGQYIPLGYVRSNGKAVNRTTKWKSGGVLVGSDDGIELIPIGKFNTASDITEGVQSKPMLIDGGKDGIRSSDSARFDRSAVGITQSNVVILAVASNETEDAATLSEFSRLLIELRSKSKESIEWALAMDGGPGAHLYIPSLRAHCGKGKPPYVPNVVVWEAR